MFSTANTFKLILPTEEQIVFGIDDTSPDWVGLIGQAGVTSSVDLRESRSNISRADGEILGASFFGTRSVVADIFIVDTFPETRGNKIAKLQRVNYLLRETGLLQWTETETSAIGKQLPVRLQSFPTITHNSNPTKSYQISLTSTQPHIESQNEIVETFVPEEETDVFTFTLTNEGDWMSYPVIKITTPAGITADTTDLTITNTFNNKQLKIENLEIEPEMELIIDNRPTKKTITQTIDLTTSNIYNKLNVVSEFINFEAGENPIEFDFNNYNFDVDEIEIEFSYRYAWI